MYHFTFYPDKKLSKLQQITRSIIVDIEKGVLPKDTCLPSINAFSAQYDVARDTIEKAYKKLKNQGYIKSVAGKGYFVREVGDRNLKLVLIIDKLISFRKSFYESFIDAITKIPQVDLHVHYCDDSVLKEIIENRPDVFDYYIVMPCFFPEAKKDDYLRTLKKIPSSRLAVLDKNLRGEYENAIIIFQDYKKDIYSALTQIEEALNKYDRFVLIIKEDTVHSTEIALGVEEYCLALGKKLERFCTTEDQNLKKGTVYILTEEKGLADVIKKLRTSDLTLGCDIGMISFNECVLKELLGIATFSMDFEKLVNCTLDLLLNKKNIQMNNFLRIISRDSI